MYDVQVGTIRISGMTHPQKPEMHRAALLKRRQEMLSGD